MDFRHAKILDAIFLSQSLLLSTTIMISVFACKNSDMQIKASWV